MYSKSTGMNIFKIPFLAMVMKGDKVEEEGERYRVGL